MNTAFAPRAACLISATVFSFPGIVTYSGAKPSSRSIPSVFVGRSRTWPTVAFTAYADPRYLPMVLALAGDSTMTSDRLPRLIGAAHSAVFGVMTTLRRDFLAGALAMTGTMSARTTGALTRDLAATLGVALGVALGLVALITATTGLAGFATRFAATGFAGVSALAFADLVAALVADFFLVAIARCSSLGETRRRHL